MCTELMVSGQILGRDAETLVHMCKVPEDATLTGACDIKHVLAHDVVETSCCSIVYGYCTRSCTADFCVPLGKSWLLWLLLLMPCTAIVCFASSMRALHTYMLDSRWAAHRSMLGYIIILLKPVNEV